MRFWIAFLILSAISVTILWKLVGDFRFELASARPKIEAESFEKAKEIANAKSSPPSAHSLAAGTPSSRDISNLEASREDSDKILNPRALEAFKTNDSKKNEEPKKAETVKIEDKVAELVLDTGTGKQNFWCKSAEVQVSLTPPVCQYPEACFSCGESELIVPSVGSAEPFCANGKKAARYSIACCPSGVDNGKLQCPSPEDCFHQDFTTAAACTCNDRDNCRWAETTAGVECVCQ